MKIETAHNIGDKVDLVGRAHKMRKIKCVDCEGEGKFFKKSEVYALIHALQSWRAAAPATCYKCHSTGMVTVSQSLEYAVAYHNTTVEQIRITVVGPEQIQVQYMCAATGVGWSGTLWESDRVCPAGFGQALCDALNKEIDHD